MITKMVLLSLFTFMDLAQKEKHIGNSYDCQRAKRQCRGNVVDTQNTI